MTLDADACYLAMKAHDARFDGRFFTGVTSTGIYCRPVCRVKLPKRENCRFFDNAALAEHAGFRPCLRCRPELAPPTPSTLAWSIHDASQTLAQQAAQLLDAPELWGDAAPSVDGLATRLGVSDRHVRRIFEAEFGVAPMQYLQTRRLLTAKQLLTDTRLPVTQVAMISGFASLRRFNAAFVAHYGLNPSQLRKEGAPQGDGQGIVIRLGYRPPYDVDAMLGFFEKRRIAGIELVERGNGKAAIGRTLRIPHGAHTVTGWMNCEFDAARHELRLLVSDSLREALPLVIRRVRQTFDLDADPQAIHEVLGKDFPEGAGLRVPGAMDGFELAVRAVLGQQITVAAARTLAQRLVDTFGEPLQTPWPALTRLFPSAAVLAQAGGEALGRLGIVRQRQAAIVALAQATHGGQLQLHPGADIGATMEALKALPGIGDWTAHYIAMRALRWPDAFPAGDVALQSALGVRAHKQPARAAEAASQAWRPWRSYAVLRAWSGLAAADRTKTADAMTSIANNALKTGTTR